jgi:hypothetical protein
MPVTLAGQPARGGSRCGPITAIPASPRREFSDGRRPGRAVGGTVQKDGAAQRTFATCAPGPTCAPGRCSRCPGARCLHPAGPETDGWQKVGLCDGREGYVRGSVLGDYFEKPASEDEKTLRGMLVDAAFLYCGSQYRWGGKTLWASTVRDLPPWLSFCAGSSSGGTHRLKKGSPSMRFARKDAKPATCSFSRARGHVPGKRLIYPLHAAPPAATG